MIPFSYSILEDMDDLHVKGESKMKREVSYAKKIPQEERLIIDKKFLEREAPKYDTTEDILAMNYQRN